MIEKYKNKTFNLLAVSFLVIILFQFVLFIIFSRRFISAQIDYKITEIFPTLVASSNTDLLLKEDFASLRVNLENVVNFFAAEQGIAYIAVVDLYYEVTAAFSREINPDDRAIVLNRLRTLKDDFRFRREFYLNRTRDNVIEVSVPLSIEDDNFGTIKIGYLKSYLNRDLVINTRHIIMRTIFVIIIAGIILIFVNHKIADCFEESFVNIKKGLTPQIRDSILMEFKKKEEEEASSSTTQIPPQKMLMIINSIDKILTLSNNDDILQEAAMIIIKIFQAREASVYILNKENKELMTIAFFDKTGLNINQDELNYLTISLGDGDTGKAVQLNLTVISEKPVPGYVISFPLTANNQVIGAIRLTAKTDGTTFGQPDRILAKLISSLIGNIINANFKG